MSYLKAISEALESQRYRYLPGGDKGIAKAILKRDDPRAEDYEYLLKIVENALSKELEIHLEGIEKDIGDTRWAKELAETHTKKSLQERLTYLNGLHVGPEINEAANRSTSKAVANEAARDSFREKRVIEMALDFLEADDRD